MPLLDLDPSIRSLGFPKSNPLKNPRCANEPARQQAPWVSRTTAVDNQSGIRFKGRCHGNLFLFILAELNGLVLRCCWLGGRRGIRPVKTEWWGVGVVICLERDADLHMARLMPLPLTVSCVSNIQIGFTFLVPGSPEKGAVKRVCVYVCVWQN